MLTHTKIPALFVPLCQDVFQPRISLADLSEKIGVGEVADKLAIIVYRKMRVVVLSKDNIFKALRLPMMRIKAKPAHRLAQGLGARFAQTDSQILQWHSFLLSPSGMLSRLLSNHGLWLPTPRKQICQAPDHCLSACLRSVARRIHSLQTRRESMAPNAVSSAA